MPQETTDTKDIFMEVLLKKYEQLNQHIPALEKRLADIGETTKSIVDYTKEIEPVKNSVSELRAMVKNIRFPELEMEILSKALVQNVQQLKQPVKTSVIHQHHVHKIIWAAVGLFLVLCLVCSGWYMTASEANQYKASDTKFRRLKLVADPALQQYLVRLDSVYLSDPEKMRADVTEQEQLLQQRATLMEQVQTVEGKLNSKGGDKK
ncbi:MAG TPA: hypothetical protein VGM63_20525 [Mucilaginibacter sp.]